MEKLTVDPDGKITIPPEIVGKRGLQPGDELALVEAAEGLLVYQNGVDAKTLEWWGSLSHEDRRRAEAEARRYEGLCDSDRETIWNERSDSIEVEAESEPRP